MMLPTYREDGSLNVMVETPRGSAVKYKYDPEGQVMTLSRPLPSGLVYPYDWGFVAATRAADGDALDAMIVWDVASHPGILIPSGGPEEAAAAIESASRVASRKGRRRPRS